MSNLKIQLTEDEYRIVIDGTPTEPAQYGESIECEVDGHRYMALADVGDGDGDTVESQLDSWVYVDGAGVEDVEIEDVDAFDGEGDAVEGDGGEGDEDEDEPDADDETEDEPESNITQK
jgi:hypothetical protein